MVERQKHLSVQQYYERVNWDINVELVTGLCSVSHEWSHKNPPCTTHVELAGVEPQHSTPTYVIHPHYLYFIYFGGGF